MNILLVGEFSRLHNSLKEGLEQLGHKVTIVGFKDGFKDYPADFPIVRKWDSALLKKFKAGVYKISGFDIDSYFTYRQFKKNQLHFTGFDIVQLINENSFYCGYHYETKILDYLFKNNGKAFLMCCGNDYSTVKYEFEHPEKKSILQPYLDRKISEKDFGNVLKFRKEEHKKIHDFIYKNISGIIASDVDYLIPMRDDPKFLGMIPNPINIEQLEFNLPDTSDKIIIFHGINEESYIKKGNDYFEKALAIVQQKYAEKVEIITTRSIPYKQYIKLYNKAHILLDMVYAYDQGYNALEAMAKGKVVFTGAEKEFKEFYGLTENVNINAKPDVGYLVSQLSFLIENPEEIRNISQRARAFVEREHHYTTVAKKYLNTWNQS
jgi:glycosyltransferase involved in cell wall biosynthesis